MEDLFPSRDLCVHCALGSCGHLFAHISLKQSQVQYRCFPCNRPIYFFVPNDSKVQIKAMVLVAVSDDTTEFPSIVIDYNQKYAEKEKSIRETLLQGWFWLKRCSVSIKILIVVLFIVAITYSSVENDFDPNSRIDDIIIFVLAFTLSGYLVYRYKNAAVKSMLSLTFD